VDVIFDLTTNATDLRDGDLMQLTALRSVREQGFWLPRTALTEAARSLWGAYVAIPNRDRSSEQQQVLRLDRRQVEVLHVDGDRVFVRGAIADGDRVVTEGLHRLVPGQLVTEANL
jgi:hypothetical protein